MSVQKCVHQSCGKTFTDVEEECHYHPGPPVFHEGQKGKRTNSQPSACHFYERDTHINQVGNAANHDSSHSKNSKAFPHAQ